MKILILFVALFAISANAAMQKISTDVTGTGEDDSVLGYISKDGRFAFWVRGSELFRKDLTSNQIAKVSETFCQNCFMPACEACQPLALSASADGNLVGYLEK